jgi:hypothetical protein
MLAWCLGGVVPMGTSDAAPSGPVVRWLTNPAATAGQIEVEVEGLAPDFLAEVARAATDPAARLRAQASLTIHVGSVPQVGKGALPAMAGTYSVVAGKLRFAPAFPLAPGVEYHAVLHREALPGGTPESPSVTATHRVAPLPASAPTFVTEVYPTARVLPENILKFYLQFSAPMSGGGVYRHLRLLDDQGRAVELPFLEIDEELWDPDMRRLTLLLDPGRIKRGLRPLDEVGPPLRVGKEFTLVIDPTWRDASGQPLRESFQRRFKVDLADRESPDPKQWGVKVPRAGGRDPLELDFREPLDHALVRRLLQVVDDAGVAVVGELELGAEERTGRFRPRQPWSAGRHYLLVNARLEDLAGNNPGKLFDVELAAGTRRGEPPSVIPVSFTVPPAER